MKPGEIGVQFRLDAARLASIALDVRRAISSLPDLDLLLRGMPEQIEAMELCMREISGLLAQRATKPPASSYVILSGAPVRQL